MTDAADDTPVYLPARTIPPPLSVSPQARAALARGAVRERTPNPPIDDIDAWHAHVASFNELMLPFVDQIMGSPLFHVETRQIGTTNVYVIRHADVPPSDHGKINLHLHGGGWAYAGGRCTALPAAISALHYGGTVYAPDYRTTPDHPFPAALDDCLATYRALLKEHDPASILVTGDSAGANLASAMLLRARDEGLPPPCALFLNTPAVDLTLASDSWAVNDGVDVVLRGLGDETALYCRNADPRDPHVSPLFGDLSRGFPPTYIRTGTRDLLLSDSVRMHAALRKAGVEADLYVGEAMPHGGFAMLGADAPEDVDARADMIRWLARHWKG
ncbi:alpha/beta hydrolase [Sphingomonas sp.]|uniref:alpha/beta hydrolase n=1 Tax=Sphingomonas sp. TaxID=28214 RepID=UPI0035A8BE06